MAPAGNYAITPTPCLHTPTPMTTRRTIEIAAFCSALLLAALIFHAWLAAHDDQLRLASTLATQKQALDAADARERDRNSSLKDALAQIDTLKRNAQKRNASPTRPRPPRRVTTPTTNHNSHREPIRFFSRGAACRRSRMGQRGRARTRKHHRRATQQRCSRTRRSCRRRLAGAFALIHHAAKRANFTARHRAPQITPRFALPPRSKHKSFSQ